MSACSHRLQTVRLKSRRASRPTLTSIRSSHFSVRYSPQYRMRNDEVAQERVSQERDIEAYDAVSAAAE